MSFLQQILFPMQHCESAAIHFCKKLGVKITDTTLAKALVEHPDYPSISSIKDVFGVFGIASECYRFPVEHINRMPLPFIAYIKGHAAQHGLFVPVYQIVDSAIQLYNPETRKNEIWDANLFGSRYLGIVLAAEIDEKSGEKKYAQMLRKEKQQSMFHLLLICTLPVLTIASCVIVGILHFQTFIIAPILFTLFTLAGCTITVLLLWYEVNHDNPALRKICRASAKVNCSAILHSKASKIYGISWSSIGVIYYLSILFTLLATGIINVAVLQLVSWLNLLALPYVFFSIYYQWRIAKQWCLLCMLIQGVLVFQFVTALLGGFYNLVPLSGISVTIYVLFITAFSFITIVISVLLSALGKAKISKQKAIELQRVKRNPQIFETLLVKQKAIEKPAMELGISIGATNAKFGLIKVCNPYCGPCARTHAIIEELVAGNDMLNLQIIFTFPIDKETMKAPVAHLLAIAEKENKELMNAALGDWYNAPRKEYAVFAKKYPMNGELKLQDNKIKKMKEWCDTTQITFTPTFFLCTNMTESIPIFYQLPELYTVADLKYLLSE